MSDLTKMKWPQCFFKKKSRSDKKLENEKCTNNDSEDDIDAFDEKQLDDVLYKFSEEIFYDEEIKERLLKMDVNQKRILIKSSRHKFQSSFDYLEIMLEKLRRLSQEGESEDQETEKLFDQLSAALRTESLRYVRQFMEANGLGLMFTYMRDYAVHSLNSQIFSQCIRCIRSLGNSENGYDYLLAFKSTEEGNDDEPGLIEVIGTGLWSKSGVTVSMICELFGALCFTEDGWLRVMKALLFLSRNDVHHRFDILVQQFLFQENLDVKCAVLSLINAIAEFVQEAQNPVINRVHLRYQTVKCGLGSFIRPFRDCSHNGLRKQIEVFIQHQKEDVDLLRKKNRLTINSEFFDESLDDWDAFIEFLGCIRSSISCTDAQIHLTSLLHHLLLLPLKDDVGFLYLQLLDTMVQQISIHQSDSEYPDPGLKDLQINVDQLLTRLATDNDLKAKQMEVDDLVLEQKFLSGKVLELENQCFSLQNDKNELQEMCTTTAAELDGRNQVCDQISLDNEGLRRDLSFLRIELERMQTADAARLSNAQNTIPAVVVHSPLSVSDTPPPAPPPPPPPPPAVITPRNVFQHPPPAPPPPPQTLKHSATTPSLPEKSVPKVASLKCLNWTKVPQAKLSESIWSNVNENHLYSKLDLEALQTQFSTVGVEAVNKGSVTPTMALKSAVATPSHNNVISHQRSQNLFIKLKPARITWPKWEKCLFDARVSSKCEGDRFPHQLAEGLLSLYPTSEEIELLEDAVTTRGLDNLPEAEAFMFECYKFPHYLERLSSLIFLCKAPEHIKRLTTELRTAQLAIQTVMKSPLLPKLLEIVLAVGNVMNQKRGVAYGFKMESLNQLKKLKCSQTGSDGVNNLLEFVITIAEKNNPAVLELPKSLECVQAMTKINVCTIGKDVSEITCGINKLSSAIDLIKRSSREPCEGDHFLEVASDLHTSISNDFVQLNLLHKVVKVDIERCHQFFGENAPSASSSPDSEDSTQKLFTEFALFLSDMNNTWRKILSERERKVMIEQRKSVIKVSSQKPNVGMRKGELDVNISRLLSGDAFKENRLFMARQNQRLSQELETV